MIICCMVQLVILPRAPQGRNLNALPTVQNYNTTRLLSSDLFSMFTDRH